jgi:hypothetical protein
MECSKQPELAWEQSGFYRRVRELNLPSPQHLSTFKGKKKLSEVLF